MPAKDDPEARLRRVLVSQHRTALRIAELEDALRMAEARLDLVRGERDVVLASTFWRATRPLRRLIDLVRRLGRAVPGAAADPRHPDAYASWADKFDTLTMDDRADIDARVAHMPAPPRISVVMPVYDPNEAWLRTAIASVRAQAYPHWQLCIADDASPAPHVAAVLAEAAASDSRICVVRLPVNGNICAATNAALALADGAFVALMDHDDILPAQALYEVAAAIKANPDAALIYSDEDHLDPTGRRATPYLKPDFSLDLLRAHNLISHLGVYRRDLLERLGGMRLGYEGSQDYDLALRAVDAIDPAAIHHIPAVLYHWRQDGGSFSKARLDRCVAAARHALRDHLDRRGETEAELRPNPRIPVWTRVVYKLPDPAPLITVIVPTRDRAELLARCAEGVLHGTDYPNLELLIVDNDSEAPETARLFATLRADPRVRILPHPGPFNFAAMNNAAVQAARGTLICLLNNDIEITSPGWLREMASHALRPAIGAVGARLLFPDGTVQHAGVALGVGSFADGPGVAWHLCLHEPGASLGYCGAAALARDVSAVTAACMVLRRQTWIDAGGMDAAHLAVAFNDVDFCLRLRERGLSILFTPFAELVHHESASRGDDLAPEHRPRFDAECQYMRDRWGAVLDDDPFYNPQFSRQDANFRLFGPALRFKPWA